MARNVGELSLHILSECEAVIYRLEGNTPKPISDEHFARVQLVAVDYGSTLSHKIRGTSLITGEIIINVALEKDVFYTILDKSYHQLQTTQNTFWLKISETSNVQKFGLTIQNILLSKQDNNSPSPRQAWMPTAIRQSSPVLSPQPIREQFVNAGDTGNELPLRFLAQSTQRPTLPGIVQSGLSTSTPTLAPAHKPTALTAHIRVNAQTLIQQQLDSLCDRLANAISSGDTDTARELSQLMAEQKIPVYIKQKNPKMITVNGSGDSFSLKVIVEDRETSGGSFSMKVSPSTTIAKLQEEVSDRYGFPPKVQKWIIAKKLGKPHDTLFSLNIKNAGSTAYLYLVSGQSVGLKREEFEHFVNRTAERRNAGVCMSMEMNNTSTQAPVPRATMGTGPELLRTSSLPNVNNTRPSSAPTEDQRAERQVELPNAVVNHVMEESNLGGLAAVGGASPTGLPVGNALAHQTGIPVHQERTGSNPELRQPPVAVQGGGILTHTVSISDIEKAIREEQQGRLAGQQHTAVQQQGRLAGQQHTAVQQQGRLAGQEQTAVQPQGWSCQECTFINSPTRPGCEICGSDRPASYVVPQNPAITEQERMRLEREREQTEIMQRTLDRQQQEQEQAREMNFRQLVQTAQQNLIRNTEEFDCAICFLNVPPGEGVVLRECLHCFCQDCLREHIRNCTDPEVQCPFQDNDFACHFVITAQEIKALLPEEDFNKFLNRSLATAESQASNSFHCKTPNCPGWCIYEDNTNVFHCPVCQKVNCLTCKAIHHPEMNCKEYQEDLQRRAQNDSAAKQTQKFLEQMIAKGDAMKCPQCAIILLKKDGCDWMRCSMCRLEICWATRGPRWGPQGVGDLSGGCKCRVGGKRCHPKCKNCH